MRRRSLCDSTRGVCRYADDCNIYVRSRRAGERVMASVCRFLRQKLRLTVNASKSAVARPDDRKFLGFRLTTGAAPQRLISPEAVHRFQARVRELTNRTRGISIERMVGSLKPYLLGWRSYFGFSQDPRVGVHCTQGGSRYNTPSRRPLAPYHGGSTSSSMQNGFPPFPVA